MPEVDRYARVEFEQFANTSSASLTLDQWLALAKRLNAIFAEEPDLAGVVVTSGTDTLEETAYFLDLTVRTDKPVVVVGSMRNPSTLGYEGAANLLEGVRVAADPQSRGKGVLVVLNDEINAAREVTKTDARRLQTFQTRGYGVLGVVDADRVVYYRAPVKRHMSTSEFDVSKITTLPRVDIAMVYQGRQRRRHQGDGRSGREGHRHRVGGRRRDERDAGGRHSLRDREGRVRRDQHAHRIGPHRRARRRPRPRTRGVRASSGRDGRQGRRQRQASPRGRRSRCALPHRGRRSRAGQGAHPAMLALTVTQDQAEIQRMFTEY